MDDPNVSCDDSTHDHDSLAESRECARWAYLRHDYEPMLSDCGE